MRCEKIVPGIGPVDRDEILKSYEVEKGEYVLLEPEEIEKVRLESRKTLELTQFVDLADIDPIYYDKPYYVVPADDLAEDAFVVLREARSARPRRRPGRGVDRLVRIGCNYRGQRLRDVDELLERAGSKLLAGWGEAKQALSKY